MRALLPLLLLAGCPSADDTAVHTDADSDSSPVYEGVGELDTLGPPEGCSVDLSTTWAPDARLLRHPYTTSVTDTQVVLQFGLPPGSTGTVKWGATGTLDQTATAQVQAHDALVDPLAYQVVTLTGLSPSTSYCFQVELDGQDLTGPLSFRTAPSPNTGRTVRWLVLGDYGNGSEAAAAVYRAIQGHLDEIDFWLTTGDNAYSKGTWDEWQNNHFAFYSDLMRRVPYFPTPGNHDYGDDDLVPMIESFVLPRNAYREEDFERYYSFDWGPLHFTVADSQKSVYLLTAEPDDDMMDWFRADLAAATEAKRPWVVPVWHHPVYMSQPDRNAELGALLQLKPAAEAADVPLVLNGHNHNYERYGRMKDDAKVTEGLGTTYVTTGGGGAGLYEVTNDPAEDADVAIRDAGLAAHHFMLFEADRCVLKGRAIDTEGTVIDSFELDRCE